MLIFKDLFTEDEMMSDSFPYVLEDDVVYKVTTKVITKSEGDYNTAGDDLGEKYDPTSVSVNNLVDAHRLVETPFNKKNFMTYIKGYMTKLKKHLEKENPDRVEGFMKAAQAFVKKIVTDFDQYQFFTGEKMDVDGMVAFLRWDGETPYFYIWKDGLKQEKY